MSSSECPLCQQANGCAVEKGQSIDDCWCKSAVFPKFLQPKVLLPKVLPPNADACLCAECAARLVKLEALGLKQVT